MGMVWDIKRFAIHDGPGIRTTVFFKGCPLDCWWCHNPESRAAGPEMAFRRNRCLRCGRCVEACPEGAISMNEHLPHLEQEKCVGSQACIEACPTQARTMIGREMSVDQVMDQVRRDTVFYERSAGGVTFSGGEPLMQPEFLCDLLKACRGEGIHTVLDTTGHASPEVMARVAEHVDLFLYDLKIMDDDRHREYCGVSNQIILDNLRDISQRGLPVIVRFPLVPGVNDDEANLDQLGRFVADLPAPCPVDILPYQAMGVGKYEVVGRPFRLPEVAPPAEESIALAVDILGNFGLEVMVKGQTP